MGSLACSSRSYHFGNHWYILFMWIVNHVSYLSDRDSIHIHLLDCRNPVQIQYCSSKHLFWHHFILSMLLHASQALLVPVRCFLVHSSSNSFWFILLIFFGRNDLLASSICGIKRAFQWWNVCLYCIPITVSTLYIWCAKKCRVRW